jgi:hypothetical protein
MVITLECGRGMVNPVFSEMTQETTLAEHLKYFALDGEIVL